MFLFALRQLHRLPKMEGHNQAASYKRAYLGPYWKRVILFLFILIFLWGVLSASQQQLASQGLFTTTVSASGLLQGAVYNLNQTGGPNIIKEIDVTQGQYVRQGQILARLDPTFLQRAVDTAQSLVDDAQEGVNVGLARQARAIKEQQALVALAVTNFHVAQAILQADQKQAQANINAAQVNLTTQERVLATTQRQAEAQIAVAQSQLNQSIATCRDPSPSGTPTPAPQMTGHPTPAPQTTGHPTTATPTSASRTTGDPATTQTNTVQACIHRAQLQYQQVVATTQTAIVTAQAMVTRFQAAVKQAIANANVTLTTAQGAVSSASAAIVVANFAPDLLVAAKDLVTLQHELVEAVALLRTAQLNLAINTTLVAPHDGVVTAINGTVGGVPGPRVNIAPKAIGSADSGVFIQLVDLSHVDRILLDVSDADIMKVKVGQHVQFTVNAYANRQFSGTVSAISPNGVVLGTEMAYPVIVNTAPESIKGATLFPNMAASATIAIG